MDTLTASERSERMSRVRGKDTKPELTVRRIIHAMGYRYRLHDARLPGKPDLVFRSRGKVIFVHGCFWHRHADPDCKLARLPKSRRDFWLPKLERNAQRDVENRAALEKEGWGVLELWECQVKDAERIRNEVREFLDEVG
jgi:DNA mismatch endonuclease (patch repair protein)